MNIGFEAKRIFHNRTGLGNYSRDLVKALSRFYPENKYFLYNPKKGNGDLFRTDPPVHEKLPKGAANRFFSNYWRQSNILKDLKKDRIQIFHGLSGEIPIGLRKSGIKSVVTIHDLIFLRFPEFYSYFDRKIHSGKFAHAARNSDVIVAVSEQTKQDVVDFFKVDPSKIVVIYQGCHSAFKKEYTVKQKADVLSKYRLPDEFILNVGTIESRKNILVAVKAIKNIDTSLVIVGSDTEYSNLVKKYISDNQMEAKVLFLKNLNTEELAIINQSARVMIYPSLFEGFGIPIIEALYSKTPVITTRHGCFPEAGGPDSIYVDPTNVEEIAEKIKLLLNDEKLRDSVAEKGHKYVQKFNDENIADQMMSVYNKLQP